MRRYFPAIRQAVMLLTALLVLLTPPLARAAEQGAPAATVSREETLRLGERMYRDGILPSEEPMTAYVEKDIPVDGTMFSCVSCHLRSGLGSFEGGVLTPPTNGASLYTPYDSRPEIREPGMGEMGETGRIRQLSIYLLGKYGTFPQRPAYTDATLAAALRGGIDPAGREFIQVMPRYYLNDRDMGILITYLKSLSAAPAPGVTETGIRFATVITEEVSQKERDEMLVPLESYLRSRSNPNLRPSNMRRRGMLQNAVDPAFRRMSLARWELKGPPETWRGQLEDYYRKEPVFALLGGISTKSWQPIHDFCEEHRLPCLFPITDLPVISATGWYTLYFSKGFYQEGEAAARHLGRQGDASHRKSVVQVYRDTPEGHAYAAGFRAAWAEFGRKPPIDRVLPAGMPVSEEFLRRLTVQDNPAVLVVWLGAEALSPLAAVATDNRQPEQLYVSATLLKEGLLTVPETLRDRTYITYPKWLPQPLPSMPPRWGESWGVKKSPAITDRQIAYKMISLGTVLSEVLTDMRTNFYRDYLLDIVDGIDLTVDSPYERLSFGPGQRYAAKGCYIVQLTRGPEAKLERKSDWVIH